VKTKDELVKAVAELRAMEGPAFLEVWVRIGNRADLGRPTRSPEVNKQKFAAALQSSL
jgi:phosphonopyruvate decarboxylase